MKRITTSVLILCMLIVAVMSAFAASTIEPPADCLQCGMNRKVFDYSRVLVEFGDGTKSGTCSINCATLLLKKSKDKKLKSIKVADYDTKKLIDATTAYWVIGGDIDGVMTPVPKWAFARRIDAQKFVKEHGGWQASYKEVLQAVNEELEMKQEGGQHKHH